MDFVTGTASFASVSPYAELGTAARHLGTEATALPSFLTVPYEADVGDGRRALCSTQR